MVDVNRTNIDSIWDDEPSQPKTAIPQPSAAQRQPSYDPFWDDDNQSTPAQPDQPRQAIPSIQYKQPKRTASPKAINSLWDEPTDFGWTRLDDQFVEGAKDVARTTLKGASVLAEEGGVPYTQEELEAQEATKKALGTSRYEDLTRLENAGVISTYLDRKSKIEQIQANPELLEDQNFVEKLVRTAPQVVGQVIIGVASGGALSMPLMGLQIVGGSYENYIAQGADPERAKNLAVLNALMQMPLESIGLGAITKFIPAKRAILEAIKDVVERGLTEGLTEFVQQFPEAWTNFMAANPDSGMLDALYMAVKNPDTWKEGLEAAAIGAILGGGTSVVMKGLEHAFRPKEATPEAGTSTDSPGINIPGTNPDPEPQRTPGKVESGADAKTLIDIAVKRSLEAEAAAQQAVPTPDQMAAEQVAAQQAAPTGEPAETGEPAATGEPVVNEFSVDTEESGTLAVKISRNPDGSVTVFRGIYKPVQYSAEEAASRSDEDLINESLEAVGVNAVAPSSAQEPVVNDEKAEKKEGEAPTDLTAFGLPPQAERELMDLTKEEIDAMSFEDRARFVAENYKKETGEELGDDQIKALAENARKAVDKLTQEEIESTQGALDVVGGVDLKRIADSGKYNEFVDAYIRNPQARPSWANRMSIPEDVLAGKQTDYDKIVLGNIRREAATAFRSLSGDITAPKQSSTIADWKVAINDALLKDGSSAVKLYGRDFIRQVQEKNLTPLEKVYRSIFEVLFNRPLYFAELNKKASQDPAMHAFKGVRSATTIGIAVMRGSESRMIGTIYHEMTHDIKRTNPALWSRLDDFLMENVDDSPALQRELKRLRSLYGNKDSVIRDEFVSNMVGGIMERKDAQAKLFKKMRNDDPGLFKQMMDAIRDVLQKFRAIILDRSAKSKKAESLIKDMDKSIEFITNIISEHAETARMGTWGTTVAGVESTQFELVEPPEYVKKYPAIIAMYNLAKGKDTMTRDPYDYSGAEILKSIGYKETSPGNFKFDERIPKDADIIAGMFQAAWNIDLRVDGGTKELYRKIAQQLNSKQRTGLGKKESAEAEKKLQEFLEQSWATYADGSRKTKTGYIKPTKNLLIRPAGVKSGRGRILMVQVSSNHARAEATAIGDTYFDTLYSEREGYQRPADFWEVPEWVGRVSKFAKTADFYVVRNIDEARMMLARTEYEYVMFSVMDANKHDVRALATSVKYPNKRVLFGGYVDKSFLRGIGTWHDTLESAANKMYLKFEDGVDYRHFVGTETIPRLELSSGCKHKCAFCIVDKNVVEASDERIDEQLEVFKNLKYKLVYLNDKTFGQASNYQKLIDIKSKILESNPDFQGFIIQTTAPQFLKMPTDFLEQSGIKFVELGAESYNDDILKKVNKPHNTMLIDKAVEKIRSLEMNFVPNLMVGLAGVEKGSTAKPKGKVMFRGRSGSGPLRRQRGRGAYYFTTDKHYAREYGRNVEAYDIVVNKTWDYSDLGTGKEIEAIKKAMREHPEAFITGEEGGNIWEEAANYGDWMILEDPKIQKMLKDAGYDSYRTTESGTLAVFNKKNVSLYGPSSWTETAKSYGNTLKFLDKNKDIISHINIYVLATYEGTALHEQLGGESSEIDLDENVIQKSWLKNQKIHEKFYSDVIEFGTNQIKSNKIEGKAKSIDYKIPGFTLEPDMEKWERPALNVAEIRKSRKGINQSHEDAKKSSLQDLMQMEKVYGEYEQAFTAAKDKLFEYARKAGSMKNVSSWIAKQKTLNGLPVTDELVKSIGNLADRVAKDPSRRKALKEAIALRDGLATGKLNPTDPKVVKRMKAIASSGDLKPYTIRYKTENFWIGNKTRYGHFKTGGELFGGEVGKETVQEWTSPVTGLPQPIKKVYDVKGNRLIEATIFSEDRPTRMKQIKALVKRNIRYADWYVRWKNFMWGFVDRGVDEVKLKRIVSISGMIGNAKDPQTQQILWARAINMLEAGRKPAFIGRDNMIKAIDIWEGKHDELLSRTDADGIAEIVNTFGRKIGPYLAAAMDPNSPNVLVIDRHMPKLWGYNILQSADSPQGGFNLDPGVEYMITNDIAEAAKDLNLSVAGVQAALWFEARSPKSGESDIVKVSQIEPSKTLPYVFWKKTVPDEQMDAAFIHYKKTLLKEGDFVVGSTPDGKAKYNTYSMTDIGERIKSATPNWPYEPVVYMYRSGGAQESQVKTGRKAHTFKFNSNDIYDGFDDPLSYWETAKEENAKDPGASLTNIFLNLIRRREQYKGVLVKSPYGGEEPWLLMFEKVAVQDYPELVNVGISDVVASEEEFPQDPAKAVELMKSRGSNFEEFLKSLRGLKKYEEITIDRADPSIARFGEATEGVLEAGLGLKLNGPLRAIRSFLSEAAISRIQKWVYIMHGAREDESYPIWMSVSTGKMFIFKAIKKYDDNPAQLIRDLTDDGFEQFNIVQSPSGWMIIEQFTFNDDGASEMARLMEKYAEKGFPHNEVRDVHSEVIGDEDLDVSIEKYTKAIYDYWGEKRGKEIVSNAIKEREEFNRQIRSGAYQKKIVAGAGIGSKSKGPKFVQRPGGGKVFEPQLEIDKVETLITKPIREFHGKFMSDISERVAKSQEKVAAYTGWKFDVGDRVKSKKLNKVYEITGRSWNTRSDEPVYFYEGSGEKGMLKAEASHESMIRLSGPVGIVTPQLEIDRIIQDAREYKNIDDFVDNEYKRQIRRRRSIGGAIAKKLGGKFSRKVEVPKDLYSYTGDYSGRITVEGGNIYFIASSEHGTIYVPNLVIDKKGGGIGTKFMLALKEFADETSQNIEIYKVTNPKFFQKFDWLKKDHYDDFKYESKTNNFVGVSDLMDIWHAQHPAPDMEIDDDTKDVLNKVGRTEKSLSTKFAEKTDISKGDVRNAVQGGITAMVDKLNPIRRYAGAESSAYMLHRALPGVQSSINAMMEHGKLRLEQSGVLTTDTRDKGFIPWLKKLGPDSEKFWYWLIANRDRARAARDDKYTPMFTEKERSLLLNWTGDRTSNGKPWQVVNKEFQEFNNSVLQIGIDSGLLDPAMVRQFKDQFYIPFYRIFEDEEATAEFIKAPVNTKKIISAQIKKLKGTKEYKIGDPLENILANWSHLIKQSMTNQARKDAFNSLNDNNVLGDDGLPVVEEVPWAGTVIFKSGGTTTTKSGTKKTTTFVYQKTGDEVLGFKDNGKTKFFKVNDTELFQALSLHSNVHLPRWLSVTLGAPKALLTFGATITPSFMAANMTRDTMHTFTISKGFIPFWDTAKAFIKTLRKDEDYVRYAASGNAFVGSYIKADRPEVFSKFAKRIVKREGQGALGRLLDTPAKLWGFWETFTEASENATRLALYTRMRAAGKTELEASFAARDIMDFQMKGASPVVQYLTATVPFLNARIQGLYKMGTAALDNPKMYALKGAMIAMASIALWAAFKDDDRYKELEEWEKFTYYHFWIGDAHFRIPKPFETGVLWSSAWTAAADVLVGNEEVNHITSFIGQSLLDTFAFNPIPQAGRPILEQYFNKNFFTGRPIEPEGFRYRAPADRFYPWDSETAQVIGRVLGVSPRRVQSLVRGYLAGLGLGVMAGADMITRFFGDFPERPEAGIESYPLIGRFVRGEGKYSRYQTKFYDIFNELNELTQTIKIAERDRDFPEVTRLRREHSKKIQAMSRAKSVKRDLAQIRKEQNNVWESKVMSPKQKAEKLEELQKRRVKITKEFYEWYMSIL